MKGQVAAEAVAIASLAREGFEPAGDLVFAACADEEVGDGFGLEWLCEQHPDAVRTDYALNEGAGERIELFGRPFYLCSSAEKMSAPFRLLVHGRAGHASMPGIADNALVKAAPLIERLAAYRPELRLGPETKAMIQAVAGQELGPAEALELARANDEAAAELLEPLLSLTLSPTMISASAAAQRDPAPLRGGRRLPPAPGPDAGRGRAGAARGARRRRLRARVDRGLAAARARSSARRSGRRSRASSRGSSPRRRCCRSASPASPTATGCARRSARSRTASARRGRWTRSWPPRLIHSADERVAIDDLELAVDCFRHAAVEVTGGG